MSIYEIHSLISESKAISAANPQKSYTLAEKALKKSKELKDRKLEADSLLQMTYACRVMSDYAKYFTLVYEALDIYESLGNKFGILKAKNLIGIIYFYFGSYSEALENFIVASELIESYPDPKLEASILNNIGEIYREAKEKDMALKYYHLALKLSLDNNLSLNTSVIYSNIADVYLNNNDISKADEYLSQAYEIALLHSDMINQAEIETKLGRVMFEINDLVTSKDFFLSALMKLNRIKNKFYLIDLLIQMAICEQRQGLNPVKHLKEALGYSLDHQLQSKTSQIYNQLSDYYESIQDYKVALHYYKAYHTTEKELETINLSKRLEIISIEFNYYKEKKENNEFKTLTSKLKREIEQVNDELDKIKKVNVTLTQETLVDELTKLYNRRGIEQMFNTLSPFDTTDQMCAIFVLDIDNFKLYNDYWGHLQGDECLKIISQALIELQSKNIFAGRYGGEEFLCFVSSIKPEDIIPTAEEIRKAIENLKIPYTRDIDSNVVTVSIGISEGHIHRYNYSEHFNRADKALYIAKNEGRNCVRLYND